MTFLKKTIKSLYFLDSICRIKHVLHKLSFDYLTLQLFLMWPKTKSTFSLFLSISWHYLLVFCSLWACNINKICHIQAGHISLNWERLRFFIHWMKLKSMSLTGPYWPSINLNLYLKITWPGWDFWVANGFQKYLNSTNILWANMFTECRYHPELFLNKCLLRWIGIRGHDHMMLFFSLMLIILVD